MVIHSIVSIDDIMNSPEYFSEYPKDIRNKNSKEEQRVITGKNENIFSTDPFYYLNNLSY